MKRPGPNPDLELARRRKKKGAIPPVPPPDCNNALRVVHKACNRYLGEVVRASFCFSLFPVLRYRLLGLAALPSSRTRALVRAFITRAQPRRDKYRQFS